MLEYTDRSIKGELDFSDVFTINSSLVPLSEVIAQEILAEVMRFRRISNPKKSCLTPSCQKCLAPHLSKVISAVDQGLPVPFVLPAFPGKSPNLTKVLGSAPDMAERQALKFLQHLSNRVKRIYDPGIQIILCSDGRVFSDVIGMRDEDVSVYQKELSQMIVDLGLTSISTFDLDDLYPNLRFDEMRALLMARYGEPLGVLKAAISRGGKIHDDSLAFCEDDQEANRLYCGITRFLLEDATFPGQKKSRAALQKECRTRAYEVIQRSKAWGELVEKKFPNAVRLSIHPQSCGAKKLGIRLIESSNGKDQWMTPWHGVAVDLGGRFVFLKKSQAEELGARLIHQEGRPSHYILTGGEYGA